MDTDTTILIPVKSPRLRVARFTSSLWQMCDVNEIQLTQKEAFLE